MGTFEEAAPAAAEEGPGAGLKADTRSPSPAAAPGAAAAEELEAPEVPVPPDPAAFFLTKKSRPQPLPAAAGPVADSHTHLSSLRHMDPALALARAAVAGVRFLVDIVDPADDAADPSSLLSDIDHWEAACGDILAAWSAAGVRDALGGRPRTPRIRLLVGCHPHNARLFDEGARAAMRAVLAHPRCSGIGEIGLDYHYDLSPRDVQRAVFREQLELARELDAPLSLHIREAHAEAASLMAEVGLPAAGAVLHCFDLGPDDARPFQEMGCVLGLGGAVTFKRLDETREAACLAPAGGVVTETDAPYMAPEPLRGTPCEPAMVAASCRFVADLRAGRLGEDPAAFYASAFERAVGLFDRPAPLGRARRPDAGAACAAVAGAK